MKSGRILFLVAALISVLVISSAVLGAQGGQLDAAFQTTDEMTPEMTAEGTSEVFFNDNRINNQVILGEFGIYCEDAQGIAGSSYEGGGISVWGADGDQYISVEEEALRQLSDMDMAEATQDASAMMTNTPEMMTTPSQRPILLGQANGQNGPVMLFLTGDNQFQLVGVLPDGKGFSYSWTGCTGTLAVDTFEGPMVFVTTTPIATLSPVTAQPTTMATTAPTVQPTLDTTPEVTTSP